LIILVLVSRGFERKEKEETMFLFFYFFLASLTTKGEAFCWGSGVYHLAAEALAIGIGPVDSSAVCVYGSSSSLDEECPLPCQTLLAAAWGDCYCRNPGYKPKSFGANGLIKPMSVHEMYRFLAEPIHEDAKHATCRIWLNENEEDWNCDLR
jgi:hypothetical protein